MHLLITYSILSTFSCVRHYLCLCVARHIKWSQWLQFWLRLCPQIHHSFTFSLFSRTLKLKFVTSTPSQACCFTKIHFTLQEKVILNTVGPRFTNAPVHEQFGSRTNFPSKKRLGWRTVSRITNTQAGNSGKLRVSARESVAGKLWLCINPCLISVYEHFGSRTASRDGLSSWTEAPLYLSKVIQPRTGNTFQG
jgi:hypothetical protein